MQALRQFSIPFKGLNEGSHRFEYVLNSSFFEAFPDSPLSKANVHVILDLTKRSDHMQLDFAGKGNLATECDRCTADISLPFSFTSQFLVKFDEDEREEEDIIYIHPESHHLKIADILHEQMILAIPMIRTYACEEESPKPCNQKVLDILISGTASETGINNPIADAFKNLKITKSK